MAIQPLAKKTGRFLFWVGVVLTAVNIENLAAVFGLDKLLAKAAQSAGFAGSLVGVVVSPAALNVALILVGIGLAAWIDYFARRWDRRATPGDRKLCEAWESLRELAIRLRVKADLTPEGGPSVEIYSLVRAKCLTLTGHGLAVPAMNPDETEDWFRANSMYFSAIWPSLAEGHVEEARRQARTMVAAFNSVADSRRQSPLGTESETRL